MTVSRSLASAWEALRREKRDLGGVYERRIFAESSFSLFVAISFPANRRMILLEVNRKAVRGRLYRATRAFELHVDVHSEDRVRIRVEQVLDQFDDLFDQMCHDIAADVMKTSSEEAAVNALTARVSHWCRFTEHALDGLSALHQIGLFGELYFMHMLLLHHELAARVVESWVGPLGMNHDFMFGATGVEVKSTTAVNDTAVVISNEWQLDTTGIQKLFLCHMSFDKRPNSGKALPSLVEDLQSLMAPTLLELFRDRLLASGYLLSRPGLYSEFGYTLRRVNFYLVTEAFPRIVATSLVTGIHNVSYTLDLAAAGRFLDSEVNVLSCIQTS